MSCVATSQHRTLNHTQLLVLSIHPAISECHTIPSRMTSQQGNSNMLQAGTKQHHQATVATNQQANSLTSNLLEKMTDQLPVPLQCRNQSTYACHGMWQHNDVTVFINLQELALSDNPGTASRGIKITDISQLQL